MTPFLNFVSDDEDQFVPKELKRFSFDLKMAKKIGEAGKNTDICQGNVIINLQLFAHNYNGIVSMGIITKMFLFFRNIQMPIYW